MVIKGRFILTIKKMVEFTSRLHFQSKQGGLWMKAIIIDDEQHVREGLHLLADWEQFGITDVYEAKDGAEAKEQITKHRPEIIFTDMNMPKVDGIDLLKWLYEKKLQSKIIVVSGYDDYHYMRNALCYGSFDYILKPIDPVILNDTLARATSEWKKQQVARASTLEATRVINEVKPLYWDHLLTNLLTHSVISQETVNKIQAEFAINIKQVQCTVAVLTLVPIIQKAFGEDKNLAFFTLLNICNEIIQGKNKHGICFRNETKDNEIVMFMWEKSDYLISQIHECIYKCYQMKLPIAVGKESHSLQESYQSALLALKKHNLLGKSNNIAYYHDMAKSSLLHLFDYSQELMWALRSGSMEKVDEILQRLFHRLQMNNELSMEQIQAWETQFEQMRTNWLKEYSIDEATVLYNGVNYWEEDGLFSFQKFKEEKRKEFHQLLELLSKVKYQKEKNSIQEIAAYIRNHYDKEITLQEIADRFYLSREYISRRFRQEYADTITNYLTNIRVMKAKELLENPHLKIYEIAFMVGYQNEKYFSKVFKKSTGFTPNEYRAQVVSK